MIVLIHKVQRQPSQWNCFQMVTFEVNYLFFILFLCLRGKEGWGKKQYWGMVDRVDRVEQNI